MAEKINRSGIWYLVCSTLFRWAYIILFRRKVVNREHLDSIPEGEGALLAANHVSFLDPPLVGTVGKYGVFYLARKTLFESNRFMGFLYPRLNAIPVDQKRPEFGSLKKIIRLAQSGEKVVLFPEGERSRDGKMLPGQPGVGLVIAKAKVPVIPFRIYGAYEAFPRGAKFPKLFTKITVVVGEPIRFTDEELKVKDKDGYAALSQRVMDEIAKLDKDA